MPSSDQRRAMGYRWYDSRLVRPFALARLVFVKFWHPQVQPLARLRALYWWLIRRWDAEICGRCGRPVALVFHVPDALWMESCGFDHAPGGVLCVACFDSLAGRHLFWTCSREETVLYG